eukprot:m.165658 g.165658  ORF g.165658 m.165658 type:complete len:102 (-) comp15263_c2_seq35:777-1082(-)
MNNGRFNFNHRSQELWPGALEGTTGSVHTPAHDDCIMDIVFLVTTFERVTSSAVKKSCTVKTPTVFKLLAVARPMLWIDRKERKEGMRALRFSCVGTNTVC